MKGFGGTMANEIDPEQVTITEMVDGQPGSLRRNKTSANDAVNGSSTGI